MKRNCYLILCLFPLISCTRNPLQNSVDSPAPHSNFSPVSGGQIAVTLFNGSQANGSGTVALILPDGSKQQQSTSASSTVTFIGLNQTGKYLVMLEGQLSANPLQTAVTLSGQNASASVSLQMSGASMTLGSLQPQPSTYVFEPQTYYYNVQIANSPVNAMDLTLDIDPATLPQGWTYSFGSNKILGNQNTTLSVTGAEGTTVTAANLNVRALVGGTATLSGTIALTKNWALSIVSSYSNQSSIQCSCKTGTFSYSVIPKVSGVNVPSGYACQLYCLSSNFSGYQHAPGIGPSLAGAWYVTTGPYSTLSPSTAITAYVNSPGTTVAGQVGYTADNQSCGCTTWDMSDVANSQAIFCTVTWQLKIGTVTQTSSDVLQFF
jgi:hypothetical protein